MSWIKPTRDDLTATTSAEEVAAFGDSADFADAVAGILARTADLVRGYVRAGGAKIPAEHGTIPPSLLAPAMDYAAFDLLKRFNIPVSEDRRKARTDAVALFEKVAERKLAVEPADDEEPAAAAVAASPVAAPPNPARMLD
jgi:hypothetical protein